jgi:hypothetical protein
MDFIKSQKKEFIEYIDQINKLANETQKKERFLSLLERIFSNNRRIKNIIDKFTAFCGITRSSYRTRYENFFVHIYLFLSFES